MKRLNGWLQSVLLVAGSAVVAFGQSAAAPAKNIPTAADGLAKLSTLPAAGRSTISGALGAGLSGYHMESRGSGFHATSRGLACDFTARGVEISHDGAHFRVALEAYGHGNGLNKVPPATATRVSVNQVEYRYEGVTEWYVNGPLGLEQGFTVERPGKNSPGRLTVALAIEGNVTASMDKSGMGVTLSGKTSKTEFEYAGLVSTDADGKELPSSLEVRDGRLLIKVDDRGAHYPVTIDPAFSLQSTFNSFTSVDDAGISVAVEFTASDYTVVVGARGAVQPSSVGGNGSTSGVAYVFESATCYNAPSCWTQSILYPSDGATSDYFGQSVSIASNFPDPDIIVAGAWNHTVSGNPAAGEAYVFVRPTTGWLNMPETTRLTNGSGIAEYMFGSSVSASFNAVFVGEPEVATVCGSCGPGGAYVYVEPTTGWPAATISAYTTMLLPSGTPPNGSEIGAAVAGSGQYSGNNSVIVGAPQRVADGCGGCGPGFAYVYQEPTTGWPVGTMTPTAILGSPYNNQDQFGYSVGFALGRWAVVGAPNATCPAPHCHLSGSKNYPKQTGLAYQFTEPTGGWVSTSHPNATMYSTDAATGDFFGAAVSTNSKAYNVIVGAPLKNSRKGEGYLFKGEWTHAWPFTTPNTAHAHPAGSNSLFGWSASLSLEGGPDAALFGAPESSGYAGAAYLYVKP